MVTDSDPGVSTSSSTGSMDTVPDTTQPAAPAQVQPVAGQAEQPSTSSADASTDSKISPDSPFEHDEIRAAQSADDGLSIVIAYCKNGNLPGKDEVRTLPEEARELLLQWDSLQLQNDILYRKYHHLDGSTKYLQLVLLGKLHHQYVERLHADLGHFGEAKTCEAIARRVYFPGWQHYTKLIVKTCTVCNKSQRGRQAPDRHLCIQ